MQKGKRNNRNWLFLVGFCFLFFSCNSSKVLLSTDINDKNESQFIYLLDSNLYVYHGEKPIQMIGGLKIKPEVKKDKKFRKFAKTYRKCRIAELKGDGEQTYELNKLLDRRYVESTVDDENILKKIRSGSVQKIGVIQIIIDKEVYSINVYL